MSGDPIRLGFMPLADAAIPVVAARKGFAARQGLDIDLVRETSWANIRDRLTIGNFDAAHLLAPMPVATALGLTPFNAPLIAPMALGLGGNAVTVSAALWQAMQATGPGVVAGDPVSTGAALAGVIRARQACGAGRLSMAVVHAFSCHNYELRHWLAASGIHPDQDIEIAIVSPQLMPDALASGGIDGFCVGEPWNTVAAAGGAGAIILTKQQIWRVSPEKVLGVRADWAARHPDRLTRLVAAMLGAAEWCGDPAHADELAALLAAPDVLALAPEHCLPVLRDGLQLADGRRAPPGHGIVFTGEAACFPWVSHAGGFVDAMERWRQAGPVAGGLRQQAMQSFRPDLYRQAARLCGVNAPAHDEKPPVTGRSFEIEGTQAPLQLSHSRFFDAQ